MNWMWVAARFSHIACTACHRGIRDLLRQGGREREERV